MELKVRIISAQIDIKMYICTYLLVALSTLMYSFQLGIEPNQRRILYTQVIQEVRDMKGNVKTANALVMELELLQLNYASKD